MGGRELESDVRFRLPRNGFFTRNMVHDEAGELLCRSAASLAKFDVKKQSS